MIRCGYVERFLAVFPQTKTAVGSITLIVLGALLAPSPVLADATFILEVADEAGMGFNDPTPATPIGGNNGSTLGQQRRNAFEYAMSFYENVLFSSVPVVVEAKFTDLPCGGASGAVLGASAPAVAVLNVPGQRAEPNVVYPIALANHLADSDLEPDEPDIVVELNGNIDQPDCLGDVGWYYGLDGPGSKDTLETDLVRVVLHELGHGLGFIDFVDRDTGHFIEYVDLDTGATLNDRPDVFSLHVFDNLVGKRWSEMTNSERLASLTHVRNVVWDGQYVTTYAPDYLVLGFPIIRTTPKLTGFSQVISEAGYGPPLSAADVEADLVAGSPLNGCDAITNDVSDKIVLLYAESCVYEAMTSRAQNAGAVAVLIAAQDLSDSPPPHLEYFNWVSDNAIPTVSISLDDAEILQREIDDARPVTITLTSDSDRRVGADPEGRVYLLATEPKITNSISHWDFLARNDLIMEPQETVRDDIHDVDLTPALLRDIGWNLVCGNGNLDDEEECDDGPLNSDTQPDACRTTCRSHYCGDGVVDSDEQCDAGSDNSNDLPDRCRTDCTDPICGDGVVDANEQCDTGDTNSDTQPDICRTDCKNPSCGDGVVDSNEQCEPDIVDDSIACDNACSIIEQPDPDETEPTEQGPTQKQPDQKQLTEDEPVTTPSGTDAAVPGPPTLDVQNEPTSASQDDGCGCRTMGKPKRSSAPLLFILLTLTFVIRKRYGNR